MFSTQILKWLSFAFKSFILKKKHFVTFLETSFSPHLKFLPSGYCFLSFNYISSFPISTTHRPNGKALVAINLPYPHLNQDYIHNK